jgi:hypothetical protein
MHNGHVRALVLTGWYRYRADARYSVPEHGRRRAFHTSSDTVQLQATLLAGDQLMIGSCYNADGDDRGVVVVRMNVTSSHTAPPR